MDVPIFTALIGVGGSLMGTIVGGCLTMYSNFLLNKRRARAEFRTGGRLIAGELQLNERLVALHLEEKFWWTSEMEVGMKAWEEHRHVLASYLPDEAWTDVQGAIRGIQHARLLAGWALDYGTKTIDDPNANQLADILPRIRKGQASLQLYLTKPRRRLLKPLRIRRGCLQTTHDWMTT